MKVYITLLFLWGFSSLPISAQSLSWSPATQFPKGIALFEEVIYTDDGSIYTITQTYGDDNKSITLTKISRAGGMDFMKKIIIPEKEKQKHYSISEVIPCKTDIIILFNINKVRSDYHHMMAKIDYEGNLTKDPIKIFDPKNIDYRPAFISDEDDHLHFLYIERNNENKNPQSHLYYLEFDAELNLENTIHENLVSDVWKEYAPFFGLPYDKKPTFLLGHTKEAKKYTGDQPPIAQLFIYTIEDQNIEKWPILADMKEETLFYRGTLSFENNILSICTPLIEISNDDVPDTTIGITLYEYNIDTKSENTQSIELPEEINAQIDKSFTVRNQTLFIENVSYDSTTISVGISIAHPVQFGNNKSRYTTLYKEKIITRLSLDGGVLSCHILPLFNQRIDLSATYINYSTNSYLTSFDGNTYLIWSEKEAALERLNNWNNEEEARSYNLNLTEETPLTIFMGIITKNGELNIISFPEAPLNEFNYMGSMTTTNYKTKKILLVSEKPSNYEKGKMLKFGLLKIE